MSYQKKTWDANSYITPSDMNNIENELSKLDTQMLNSTALASGDDLNNYKESGLYYATSSNAPNVANLPVNAGGWVINVLGGGYRVTQIAIRMSSSEDYKQIYYRTMAYASGSWTIYPWIRLVKENDLFYQVGDTFIMQTFGVCCASIITNSAKDVQITFPIAKRLDNVSGINVTSLKLAMRHNGGYLVGYKNGTQLANEYGEYIGADNITLSTVLHKETNSIRFHLKGASASAWKNTASSTMQNNTAMATYVMCTFTFT